jgi:hypothetical protein
MAIDYGLTVENVIAIAERSKSKKDGVYSFRGICYRVRKNRVTHFALRGGVYEYIGNYVFKIGSYDNNCDWKGVKAKKALNGLDMLVM